MRQCEQEVSKELLQAVEQFNQGDWMGAHHTLDKVYMEEKGEVRYFYQALIQVGAALIHWERGNFEGALTLLDRAALHLSEVRPVCQGIDVAAIARDATRLRQELQKLGEARMAELDLDVIPRLQFVGKDPSEEPVQCGR